MTAFLIRPPVLPDGIYVHKTEGRIEAYYYLHYDLRLPVKATMETSIPNPSWVYKRLRKDGEPDRRCHGWSGRTMPERVRIRLFGCGECWDRSRGYDMRQCNVVVNGGCKCECHNEIARHI